MLIKIFSQSNDLLSFVNKIQIGRYSRRNALSIVKRLSFSSLKHSLEQKSVINTYYLNLALGITPKPTVQSIVTPTTQNIVDKLIIGQITETNIISLMESIKQELLTSN